MDINWTYRCDHFTLYINIESLCFTPVINIMLYANDTSIASNI